jgi:hypothetical protein
MSDFIDRANTICCNVSSSAAALPTPNTSTGSLISPEASDLPAIATCFPTVRNVLQSLDSQLHALGTPPSMQVLWAQALAAYETLLSDAEAAQTAAQSGDLTAYDAAASTESTDNGQADQDFNEFGATVCAGGNSSTASPSASPSPT